MSMEEKIAALRAKAARCRRLLGGVLDTQAGVALQQLAATYDAQADELEQQASGKQTQRFTRTAAD